MYPGWLILGQEELSGSYFEIINNERAYAYAESGGICWLEDRVRCETSAQVLPDGPTYTTPVNDNAPWYDPDDPDTAGFYGVVGIDIVGGDNSTRSAEVTPTLGGGGIIGPLYFGPRTLVVRALAIAESACALQAGLNWLRCQYQATTDDCAGDVLTFFDCCPCDCPDSSEPGDVCWVNTYDELRDGPTECSPDFWPSTYDELRDGPLDGETEDWCTWLKSYNDIAANGPPNWGCCVETCVVPYLRQYRRARVVEGPTVLRYVTDMNTSGAFAEIEFTVVAANPAEYTMVAPTGSLLSEGGGEEYVDPPIPDPPDPGDDPFGLEPVIRRVDLVPPPVDPPLAPQTWAREWFALPEPDNRSRLGESAHIVTINSAGNAGQVRIGLWTDDGNGDADQFIGGWYLPFIPSSAPVVIDSMNRTVTTPDLDNPGQDRRIDAFVRSFDGRALEWPSTPHGDLVVSIDREPDDEVAVSLSVRSASFGCA